VSTRFDSPVPTRRASGGLEAPQGSIRPSYLGQPHRLGHDCRLDDFSTVSPGACLGGRVQVETVAVVGWAAAMIHGIHLGAHSTLGAGRLTVRGIPSRVVA